MNNTHLFLIVLEAGKSEIKELIDLAVESLFPDELSSHCVPPQRKLQGTPEDLFIKAFINLNLIVEEI